MIVFGDFETRGVVDLTKCGSYRYAEDAYTDVLMLGLWCEPWGYQIWIPEKFRHLYPHPMLSDAQLTELVQHTTEFHAYNAAFERNLWQSIMVERYGFPELPLEVFRDTMAKAAAMNIPRQLDKACSVMGLPGKDKGGAHIMRKMCKPRPARKAEREALTAEGWSSLDKKGWRRGEEVQYLWHETPEQFQANAAYCLKDVEIERALDATLPPLTPEELEVWRLDQRMNDIGVYVDVPLVETILEAAKKHEAKLSMDMNQVTGGSVPTYSQVGVLTEWLRARGVGMPDVQLTTIRRTLGTLPPESLEYKALAIRASGSKATSCKKYEAMLRCVCKDRRVHGMFMYYGAQATGRWSSVLVQLQNLARGEIDGAPCDFEQVLGLIDQFELFGDVV